MKVIITESKYEEGIIKYLNLKFSPDYNWAGDEYYKEMVNKRRDINFYVNYERMYHYVLGVEETAVMVFMKMSQDLNRLFHNKWVPVFTKWFEQNTGLKVDLTIYYDDDLNPFAIKNVSPSL